MKKKFLILSVLLAVSTVFSLSCNRAGIQTSQAHNVKRQPLNWYDDLVFEDENLSFQLARTIGWTYSGGADIGECIRTARAIRAGDIYSWYSEWLKTANRLYAFAEQMQKEGDTVSAREAYFRASNYYRTSGFYMHAKDNRPKALETWQLSRDSFLKAIASLPYINQIEIPYEDTTLPGYFIKAPAEKAPLLIVHTGFDGTAEELYFAVGLAAHKRGYNCLLFEGPGQGEVIRLQNLPYRYDWEKVVAPVIDYALTIPEVDKDQIALMGISMGGYLAPRAAAFDYRIKACIANGGIFDFSENIFNEFPPEEIKLIETNPEEFNHIVYKQMEENITLDWFFRNGMWTFHANSPAELMQLLKKYTLKNVVERIKCHMLIVDSENDQFEKGQARKLYDKLQSPKKYILFTREEAAQTHCQIGAVAISNEVVFSWLNDVFDRR